MSGLCLYTLNTKHNKIVLQRKAHIHIYNPAQFLTILLHLIFFFFFLISSSHKIFVQDAKNNVDADLVMLEELKVKCRAQTEQIMAWKKAYSMQVIELRLCDFFFIFILWLFSLFMTHELQEKFIIKIEAAHKSK